MDSRSTNHHLPRTLDGIKEEITGCNTFADVLDSQWIMRRLRALQRAKKLLERTAAA